MDTVTVTGGPVPDAGMDHVSPTGWPGVLPYDPQEFDLEPKQGVPRVCSCGMRISYRSRLHAKRRSHSLAPLLRALYEEGRSGAYIGGRVGMSPSRVRYILMRMGLCRGRTRKVPPVVGPLIDTGKPSFLAEAAAAAAAAGLEVRYCMGARGTLKKRIFVNGVLCAIGSSQRVKRGGKLTETCVIFGRTPRDYRFLLCRTYKSWLVLPVNLAPASVGFFKLDEGSKWTKYLNRFDQIKESAKGAGCPQEASGTG